MKNKQTALQLFAIAIICVFSVFLGSFYISTNQNKQNITNENMLGNSSYVNAQTGDAQNLARESQLVNPTVQSSKNKISVVLFNYDDDEEILPSSLADITTKFINNLGGISGNNFTQKMNNQGSLSYSMLTDNNSNQVFLTVTKPSPLTKANIYTSLSSALNGMGITLSDDQLGFLFVYIGDLNAFNSGSYNDQLSLLNNSYTGTNAVYSPDVTVIGYDKTNNYSIIHGNIINAMSAIDGNSYALDSTVRSRAKAIMFKQALNYIGMPNTSYITSSGDNFFGYAGNWDILSNAPYASSLSAPYYSQQNNFYAWKFGYINDSAVNFVTTTGEVKNVSTGSDVMYIIEPIAEKYKGQAIVIQPFIYYDDKTSWTENQNETNWPNVVQGFTVARVNTMYKKNGSLIDALNTDGSYISASADFIPFYIFTPTNATNETRYADSTLYSSFISSVGSNPKSIGSLEKITSDSFNTGFISLYNNVTGKYDNSQLKITVSAPIDNPNDNTNLTIKIECNNSEVLPPVENSILIKDLHDNTENDTFIDYDVRLMLYNIYVDYDLENIYTEVKQTYPTINRENLFFFTREETSEATWNIFYNNDMYRGIYDQMHTLSPAFTNLINLDLNGGKILTNSDTQIGACREVTSLQFLKQINFVNLQGLSICNADLSSCHEQNSLTSLKNLEDLHNLKYLELNSDNIYSLAMLASLSSNSVLEKICVIDNYIEDISILSYFSTLTYANVSHNNIYDENLLTQYKNTTFYTNENIDIGLQRIPRTIINTIESTYVLENWRTSTIVKNRLAKVLSLSESFTNTGVQQSAHTSSQTDTSVTNFELNHGKYIVEPLTIVSITSTSAGRTVERTIATRYCNCMFLNFTYDTEEVCQTSESVSYDYSLNAYSNLNTLQNYNANRFTLNAYQSYPYDNTGYPSGVPLSGNIDLQNEGKYAINYEFLLTEDFKTSLGITNDYSIIVTKTLIVYPYRAMTFNEDSTEQYNIRDARLYKALLILAGRTTLNDIASVDSSNLGTGVYTLYNQDFYFYKVSDVFTPSIASIRAEKSLLDNTVHILSSLNISQIAINLYLKDYPSIQNAEAIPNDTVIVSTIAGLKDMNLSSITTLNLNSLGFSDIEQLFNKTILPNIETLLVADNKIELIRNISVLNTLQYLDLSFNLISDATPLKSLTDPRDLYLRGISTQTLRRVNLAFNQLNIKENLIEDVYNGNTVYTPELDAAGYCKGQSFVLENTVPNSSYLAQNQIYIIMVQKLQDYDVYNKSSKWQYYYTPAMVTTDTMNTTTKKYLYTISTQPATSSRATEENFYNKYTGNGQYSSYTNYSQTSGRYYIFMNFTSANNTKDKLPFELIKRKFHYVVVTTSVKNLETTYTNFPTNSLFANQKVIGDNSLTYYMLSTEYESFENGVLYNQYKTKRTTYITNWVNNGHSVNELHELLQTELTEAEFVNNYKNNPEFITVLANVGIVLRFELNVTQSILNYGSGETYWNTYYNTTKDYWKNLALTNATSVGTNDLLLPIQITITRTSTLTSSVLNDRYIVFEFNFTFNRSNAFAGQIEEDKYISNDQILTATDTYRYTIRINVIHNPEITFADENLYKAMLSVSNKQTGSKLYAFDFYTLDTLNLSNCDISTFAKANNTDYGFDSFVFSRLTKINLSHNNLTNTATSDADPMYNLFKNLTIFSPSTTIGNGFIEITYKLTTLDLSYNKIKFLSPINEYCFGYQGLIVNLFANKIELNNAENLNIIKNELARKNAGVIIGIQGISKDVEYLVSFTKDIVSSKDLSTYARFYYFQGNIAPTSGYSIEVPGAFVDITYNDENEVLYYTYYYKDTYYQDNSNYTVNFRANYAQDIIINFTSTIVHQKVYIDIQYDEFGEVIKADNKIYAEYMNDKNNQEKYAEYIEEILSKNIFTYENCSPEDFTYSYKLENAYGYTTELKPNQLTIDRPYYQKYIIKHEFSNNQTSSFAKNIYIVDTTAPIISATKDISQDKYLITKGKTYPTYVATDKIDSDITFYDDYDSNNIFDINHNFLLNVKVTIFKDDVLISEVEGDINDVRTGYGINVTEVGTYRIVYIATDYNGNVSEPYERTIEIYYQPYSWIRLSDFSASATAGDISVSATVYRGEEDINKNSDPIFNWYVDGVYSHSTKKLESLSNETTFVTETTVYVQGAGTHSIEVYVDITKEEFEESSQISGFDGSGLSLSYKNTEVFILLDENVSRNIIIGTIIAIILIIILIVIIRIVKNKKELLRNKYDYTIEKHNRRK